MGGLCFQRKSGTKNGWTLFSEKKWSRNGWTLFSEKKWSRNGGYNKSVFWIKKNIIISFKEIILIFFPKSVY